MGHLKENPQCYHVEMVEKSVQKVLTTKTSSLPMYKVMFNSFEHVEDEYDIEVAECLLQL